MTISPTLRLQSDGFDYTESISVHIRALFVGRISGIEYRFSIKIPQTRYVLGPLQLGL